MNIFDQIRKNIKANNDTLLKFITRIESVAAETGNKKLAELLLKSKPKVLQNLSLLEQNSGDVYSALESELGKKTIRLKKKLIDLQRAKETVDSDNFILEFKKKDLLKLTTDLEEAYEEITKQTNQLK